MYAPLPGVPTFWEVSGSSRCPTPPHFDVSATANVRLPLVGGTMHWLASPMCVLRYPWAGGLASRGAALAPSTLPLLVAGRFSAFTSAVVIINIHGDAAHASELSVNHQLHCQVIFLSPRPILDDVGTVGFPQSAWRLALPTLSKRQRASFGNVSTELFPASDTPRTRRLVVDVVVSPTATPRPRSGSL